MLRRKPQLDAALASRNVRRIVRAQLLIDGAPVPVPTRDGFVPIADGQVTADRNMFVRRSVDCVVTDGSLRSLLRPFGAELRVFMGARTAPGDYQEYCLGTFGIRETSRKFPGVGFTLTGQDRGKKVMEESFLIPTSFDAGSVIGRMQKLLSSSPLSVLNVDPRVADSTTASATLTGTRDQALADLMQALGAELYADTLGDFALQPIPDMYAAADYSLEAGTEGVLITDAPTESREGVFNVTAAFGTEKDTTTDAVPAAIASDNDPTSPTWVGGPFGRVSDPRPITSSAITSQAQAAVAAAARLRDRVGLAQSVSWTSLVNPAYEPSDVVRFRHPDRTVSQHVIDTLTFPLGPGAMSGQSRAVTVR